MSDHLSRLSDAVEAGRLADDEITTLLDVARDVAHSTERRLAPLSTFLAGVFVGERLRDDRDGVTREELLTEAVERLRDALPDSRGG